MMFSLQEPQRRGRGAEPGSFEVSELVVCGSARMQDKQVSPPLRLPFLPNKERLSFLLLSLTLPGLNFPGSESELL